LGARQAAVVAQQIYAEFAPTQILASPYSRAQDTAAELANLTGITVETDNDLRELTYLSPARPRVDHQMGTRFFWFWSQHDQDYQDRCDGQNGESLNEFYDRARRILARLTQLAIENHEAQIFAFSHKVLIAAVRALTNYYEAPHFLEKLARNRGQSSPIKNTQVMHLSLKKAAEAALSNGTYPIVADHSADCLTVVDDDVFKLTRATFSPVPQSPKSPTRA
jgi:broad specificity phosphatase PhoE